MSTTQRITSTTLLLMLAASTVNCWTTTTTSVNRQQTQRLQQGMRPAVQSTTCNIRSSVIMSSTRFTNREEDEEKKDEIVTVAGSQEGGPSPDVDESDDPLDFDIANKEVKEMETFEKEALDRMKPDEDDDMFEQSKDKYQSLRDAIKARTESIGIEKADNTEFIKRLESEYDADKEATSQGSNVGGMGGSGGGANMFGGIDMTQVSSLREADADTTKILGIDDIGPGGRSLKEEMALDQDAIDKLFTKEEREKIAPWLKQPIWEQYIGVWQAAEKPDFVAILKKAAILISVGFGYSALQINFEAFYKQKLIDLHIMPSKQEIEDAYNNLNIMDLDTSTTSSTPINKIDYSDTLSSNPDL